MKTFKHTIKSKIWLWKGKGAWHFVTIEKEDATYIKADYPWPRKGFGSIPVHATVGKTTWKTSIFPEKKGSYLLPIKKAVRDAERIDINDMIKIVIEVIA